MIAGGIITTLFVLWLVYEVRQAPIINKDENQGND